MKIFFIFSFLLTFSFLNATRDNPWIEIGMRYRATSSVHQGDILNDYQDYYNEKIFPTEHGPVKLLKMTTLYQGQPHSIAYAFLDFQPSDILAPLLPIIGYNFNTRSFTGYNIIKGTDLAQIFKAVETSFHGLATQ